MGAPTYACMKRYGCACMGTDASKRSLPSAGLPEPEMDTDKAQVHDAASPSRPRLLSPGVSAFSRPRLLSPGVSAFSRQRLLSAVLNLRRHRVAEYWPHRRAELCYSVEYRPHRRAVSTPQASRAHSPRRGWPLGPRMAHSRSAPPLHAA